MKKISKTQSLIQKKNRDVIEYPCCSPCGPAMPALASPGSSLGKQSQAPLHLLNLAKIFQVIGVLIHV